MKSLAVLVCLVGLALLPTSSASAAARWYGFNDSSVTAGQLSATGAASTSRAVGANSARIALNWAWVQPTDAAPNFSTFDAIYRAEVAEGIHPLITLVGSPRWTWPSGARCSTGECVYPPAAAHDAAWQRIAAALASRYPQAAGIEIWNEPNMSWEWDGGIDPARYTQLLKLAYTAIKSVDPQMPVVAGALAADLDPKPTSSAYPLPQFLQAMYRNGARGYMNGVSIHPYPGGMDLSYAYEAISDATQTRNANHDRVPLWITEAGLSVGDFTRAQQAQTDAQLFRALRPYPNLRGVYLSTLVEPPTGGDGLGVITSGLEMTPAFCLAAAVLGRSQPCPSSVQPTWPSHGQEGRWRAETLLQYAANAALTYHARHDTYSGLRSRTLNAMDRRLSSVAAGGRSRSGRGASPDRIKIFPTASNSILLCNASRADLSYCTGSRAGGNWSWWRSPGSIYAAAGLAKRSKVGS